MIRLLRKMSDDLQARTRKGRPSCLGVVLISFTSLSLSTVCFSLLFLFLFCFLHFQRCSLGFSVFFLHCLSLLFVLFFSQKELHIHSFSVPSIAIGVFVFPNQRRKIHSVFLFSVNGIDYPNVYKFSLGFFWFFGLRKIVSSGLEICFNMHGGSNSIALHAPKVYTVLIQCLAYSQSERSMDDMKDTRRHLDSKVCDGGASSQ